MISGTKAGFQAVLARVGGSTNFTNYLTNCMRFFGRPEAGQKIEKISGRFAGDFVRIFRFGGRDF